MAFPFTAAPIGLGGPLLVAALGGAAVAAVIVHREAIIELVEDVAYSIVDAAERRKAGAAKCGASGVHSTLPRDSPVEDEIYDWILTTRKHQEFSEDEATVAHHVSSRERFASSASSTFTQLSVRASDDDSITASDEEPLTPSECTDTEPEFISASELD